MKFNQKSLWVHIAVVLLFSIIPVIYFSPVLQGEVIYQSDIAQYTGMARERNEYKEETGKESYWTDSAFGGMPTYQLGANYPHDYIKKLDSLIRFLPRPADYVFLYLISFYILMLVLKVDYRLAFLGSIAFAFSTYYIIILGVGHNAKAHAIGYFPLVIAGLLLVFRRKYLWGGILAAIALALEISANHFQMTYYLLLLVLIMGICFLIDAIRKKELLDFGKSIGVLLIALVIAVLTNATNLLATQEYANWSTRGKSGLTYNPDGSKKKTNATLDPTYITDYSYGITESLDLFVPRLFGGSNGENLGEDSKTYEFLIDNGAPAAQVLDFSKSLPTYWGDQPGTSGPAYIGAVMLFFFVMGLFLVEGKYKWWLISGAIMSLLLSWGKNFGVLTDLMIEYFPLYDRFRAVSSLQVILELCVPIFGVYALTVFFDAKTEDAKKLKAVKWSGIILGSIVALLFVFKGSFSFIGVKDSILQQYYGKEIVSIIVEDRKSIYNKDLFRSFIFIALVFGILWLYLKNMFKKPMVLGALVILVAIDLIGVDWRYVNKESFVDSRLMDTPFQVTQADAQILSDTSRYRVYDLDEGLNGARASFFHNSIGGYHAAKPRRLQELFEYQIAKNNRQILNMLNIKYVMRQGQQGETVASVNPTANGNAWFVSKVLKVTSDDAEMKALDRVETDTEAIVNTQNFPELKNLPESYVADSTATVTLVSHTPDVLKYVSDNHNKGLIVFSEMYYPHGWDVTIDGKKASHFRVDYALRGLEVPSGKHTIEFSFNPTVVQKGSTITLAGSFILALLILGGLVFQFMKSRKA